MPVTSRHDATRHDDLVKGHAGFGAHHHKDAEIFSYIVDGQLIHKDSMGNKEALSRGCVQYLSAGSGIAHSEMNNGDQTCRLLQVWIRWGPDCMNNHFLMSLVCSSTQWLMRMAAEPL